MVSLTCLATADEDRAAAVPPIRPPAPFQGIWGIGDPFINSAIVTEMDPETPRRAKGTTDEGSQ